MLTFAMPMIATSPAAKRRRSEQRRRGRVSGCVSTATDRPTRGTPFDHIGFGATDVSALIRVGDSWRERD
jgi:hypothetical protein